MSNADETRVRILETAWKLARERGLGAVTVAEIAAAAGVSRQLIYVHFSNRPGLLVAMARHQDVRSGFRARAYATRELEPVAALEALMRAWQGYLPEILPVLNELEAGLLTGGEVAVAWRDRMGELREAFRFAIDRIAAAGRAGRGLDRRRRRGLGVGALRAGEPRAPGGRAGLGRGRVRRPDDRVDPARSGHPAVTECLVHIERRLGLFPVRRTYPHRTPPPETLEPGSLP